MKAPFIRSPYNYDVEKASDDAAIPADKQGESLTIQSMKDDCDLNVLMRRMGVTGGIPVSLRIPEFGDYSQVGDYQTALNAVLLAQDSFMDLPADVRGEFNNSPQLFLEFVSDPKNHEKMQKMGLTISKPSDTVPPKVDVPPK